LIHWPNILAFAALSVGLVLTPGPNMAYLISRSLCQGRAAGLVSLGGVGLGFLVYMLLAAFGVTSLLLAVPYAYDSLRIAGALYLAWLAWDALRRGGASAFRVRALSADSPRRLFATGLMTSLLNPKVAVFYLSLLPQFIVPGDDVLAQTLALGFTQIIVAGALAAFLTARPFWARAQGLLMGGVLAGLAVRMALDTTRR
jgi:threonine/homoserine/homoserine lactone efflux protein